MSKRRTFLVSFVDGQEAGRSCWIEGDDYGPPPHYKFAEKRDWPLDPFSEGLSPPQDTRIVTYKIQRRRESGHWEGREIKC